MRYLKTAVLLFSALWGVVRVQAALELPDGLYADFDTPRGRVIIELNYREVPMTVTSFVGLTEGAIAPVAGQPYYTGLKWYRVVPGFVIQSGDPNHEKNLDKDDPGTPYTFPDEFVPGLRHSEAGVLSMANAGPDTNSSEFFITLGDCTRLNYLHSVFGRVVGGFDAGGHAASGTDILQAIQTNDPFTIRILRFGAAAQAFKADEAAFKALAAQAKKYTGPAEAGPAAFFDDADKLLPTEPPRAKYFNFKLANFQRITGVKIVGRIFARQPPAAEDEVPGAYMKALAQKLGVAQTGVLVAYFAEEKDWRVWIGDDLVAAFLGRPATQADLVTDGALHDAKTVLIDGALAKGDEAFAAQQKKATADHPLHPYQQVKLETDALLDALLLRLEPANQK